MTKSRSALWTRNYILLVLINFVVAIIYGTLGALMSSYVVSDLHSPASSAGVMASLLACGAITSRLIFGNLIDHREKKGILCLGACLFTVMTLSYNFVHSVEALTVLRVMHGISNGIYTAATGALIAAIVPDDKILEGLGFFTMTPTLAAAIGPNLGSWISQNYGFPAMFKALSILGLFTAAGTFLIQPREEAISKSAVQMEKQPLLRRIMHVFEWSALIPASIMLVVNIGVVTVQDYLLLYGTQRGIANIGFYFTLNSIALLVTRPFVGKLNRVVGVKLMTCLTITGCALGLALVAVADSLVLILIASIVNGVCMGLIMPLLNAFVYKLCPLSRKGAATATYNSALEGGRGLGSLIWGNVAMVTGFRSMYLMAAAGVMLSIIVFYVGLNRKISSGQIRM